MTASRRPCLAPVQVCASTHPGLWLDKFLPSQDHDGGKGQHIQQLAAIKVPLGYGEAFHNRTTALERTPRPAGMVLGSTIATATGRIVVGLGQKSVLEVGLSLQHTWGLPYLPGSSLKGIAAWAARESEDPAWHEGGASYLALFGDTEEAGAVSFLDAWWIPDGNTLPIHLDTMTVHHPDYYQGTSADETPPSDMDSPTPIAFASTNGSYQILLEGPSAWVDAAGKLLERGLREHGVGGKTAGGYGRLELQWLSQTEIDREAQRRREQQMAEARHRAQCVGPNNAGSVVPPLLDEYRDDPALLQDLAKVLAGRLKRKWLNEKAAKGTAWAVSLVALLDAAPAPKPTGDQAEGGGEVQEGEGVPPRQREDPQSTAKELTTPAPVPKPTPVPDVVQRIEEAGGDKETLRALLRSLLDGPAPEMEDLKAMRRAARELVAKKGRPLDKKLLGEIDARLKLA